LLVFKSLTCDLLLIFKKVNGHHGPKGYVVHLVTEVSDNDRELVYNFPALALIVAQVNLAISVVAMLMNLEV